MSEERLEAMVGREYTTSGGEKKTAWTRIGVAWPQRNGGYMVILDALPAASLDDKGGIQTKFSLFPPRERQQTQPQAASGVYEGDDIPF